MPSKARKSEQGLCAQLARVVGAKYLIGEAHALSKYTTELRGRFRSECLAVVLPSSTEEVVEVVRCCAAASVSMVAQGGNTGAMGGAVAGHFGAGAGQVIVNLARMNRVLEVDAENYTMRVQAGCILADVQQAAAAHARFFPLRLGAQGSCQIGGNLATNAGGMNVLRYGNARDLTLGVEVVLADGRVFSELRGVRKNNTGYDLKNLFIGSEGTLGIITAATLKLFPAPRAQAVALVGLADADAALKLLSRLRADTDDRLSTFELMGEVAVESAVKYVARQGKPLAGRHRWYALIVASTAGTAGADEAADAEQAELQRRVQASIARAAKAGIAEDAAFALNDRQAEELLALREHVVEAQQFLGGSIKHDVAVPVAAVPEFLRRAFVAVEEALPGARPYPYGHMGDGNMHFNVSQPAGEAVTRAEFLAQWERINRVVHDIAHELGGAFSAEHGIGIAKLDEMTHYKDVVSLALYRQVKQALDPCNLMNPGKVIPQG